MRARGQRGQSLVESALVLTAFMGMVLGVVDIGQSLFSRQMLAQRVHDAARWGAVHAYDEQAIRNLVLYGATAPATDARPLLGLGGDAVVVGNPGCPGVECRVSVVVISHGIRSTEPVE